MSAATLTMMACVLLGVTLLMSLIAACAIAYDKRQARLGKGRVRENTLHLFELLGGWPGSLIARQALRHKTRDARYRLKAGGIVLLHLAAWGALLCWGLSSR